MRMLTLRRCCLPGGVDRSEGVRNTTIHYTRMRTGIEKSLFFFVLISNQKKRDARPHECSKELQEARTPPLCRCTEEGASKRNPHWRAGYSSRSNAKFLRRQYIYKIVCIWRECSAAAAGITRTRVAGSAQQLSQATLLAHAAQGTGSRTLTPMVFVFFSLTR